MKRGRLILVLSLILIPTVSYGEEQVIYTDWGDGTAGIVIMIAIFVGILIAAMNRQSNAETKENRPKFDIYIEENEKKQKVIVPERIIEERKQKKASSSAGEIRHMDKKQLKGLLDSGLITKKEYKEMLKKHKR